ncbi:MAG: tyrosine-type recombinase/integrase [Flavobacteriaceae bacterium]|nr:tyrosine-type recombinase/integrase [Flavobacteriaceae bacterium]
MSKVSFFLRDPIATFNSSIHLVCHFNGKRIKMSTELSIKPTMWIQNSMRARIHATFKEAKDINEKLDKYEAAVNKIIYDLKEKNLSVSKADFKERIHREVLLNSYTKDGKSFWFYYDEFVEHQKLHFCPSIYKDYNNSLRKHLTTVETLYETSITFSSLKQSSDSLFHKFYNYLAYEALNKDGEKGLAINTIGKNVKCLKAFLHFCFDRDICIPFSLKHMVVEQIDTDTVYLTEDEIKKLFELKKLNAKEKIVRDLFIIGCETGMRYSNFTKLQKDNYQSGNLVFSQVKSTGLKSKIIIPLSQNHKAIAESYNYELPNPNITCFEFNQTIRSLCKDAGMTNKILIQKLTKKNTTNISYEKHLLVSSHTARRSFCTNKFLNGMPVPAIMKFSGHKTERSFMKYLKLDAEITALKFKEYF